MFLFSIIVQLVQPLLVVYALIDNNYTSKYQYITKIINIKDGKEIACSGTVLTIKRVLTVAECVHGQPLKNPNVVVYYGLGKQIQTSKVSKLHFHNRFKEQRPIIWHISLLKLQRKLRLGEASKLGYWLSIANQIRTSKEKILVTAFSFGRKDVKDTYAKMTNILHLSLSVIDGPCPCFTRDESTMIYCSEKLHLKERCGDKFADAGGPIFYKDKLEGILYALYSDEHCLPNSRQKTLAPCNTKGYAVIIPICVHKTWISSRVQIKRLFFDETCAKGNNIKKQNLLIIILFFLQTVWIN